MKAARLVVPAASLPSPALQAATWSLGALAGRLVELSGRGATATLTAAFGLVLEAQHRDEPVAWITLRGSSFFPPDARDGGVDLDALAVVRLRTPAEAARAADQTVRSGGFGLVVVDLGGEERGAAVPAPLLTRLMGLAQKHDTAVVILTEKAVATASLASIVSLRAEAVRVRGEDPWQVQVTVVKDKRRGPGAVNVETCHAPTGLR